MRMQLIFFMLLLIFLVVGVSAEVNYYKYEETLYENNDLGDSSTRINKEFVKRADFYDSGNLVGGWTGKELATRKFYGEFIGDWLSCEMNSNFKNGCLDDACTETNIAETNCIELNGNPDYSITEDSFDYVITGGNEPNPFEFVPAHSYGPAEDISGIACGGHWIGAEGIWEELNTPRPDKGNVKSIDERFHTGIEVDKEWAEEIFNSRGFYPYLTPFSKVNAFVLALKCGEVTKFLGGSPVKIHVIDGDGNELGEIASGNLKIIGTEDGTWDKYVFELPGDLTTPWTDDIDVLEKLIETGMARFELRLTGHKFLKDLKIADDFGVGKCVHLNGRYSKDPRDPFKFVYKRTQEAGLKPSEFVLAAEESINEGFHDIDPFEEYKDKFAFAVNLHNYDDPMDISTAQNRGKRNINAIVKDSSNCGPAKMNIIISESAFDFWNMGLDHVYGFTKIFSNFQIINPEVVKGGLTKVPLSDVIVHETVHGLCGEYDQYPLYSEIATGQLSPNCLFQHDPLAAFYEPWADFREGTMSCSFPNLACPSSGSLMSTDEHELDVFGCGACNYYINKGNFVDRLNECCKLGSIKPSGSCGTA